MNHMVSILQSKIQKPFYWMVWKHGRITSLNLHTEFLISGYENNLLFVAIYKRRNPFYKI